MKRLLWGIGLSFSLLSQADTVDYKSSQAKRQNNQFITEYTFSSPIEADKVKIDFINQTIQVDVPGVKLKQGRETKNIQDEKFETLYSYQAEPELFRGRIILKKEYVADVYKDQVETKTEDNKLIVQVSEPEFASTLPVVPPQVLKSDEQYTDLISDKKTKEEVEASAVETLAAEIEASKEPVVAVDSEKIPITTAVQLKENEIPVLVKDTKKKEAVANPWGRFLISLGVIAIVGAGLAWAGRRWSKGRTTVSNHASIKVITQHSLGPKKSLAIIRVAGESILIGITDQNISMIKSLALLDEDVPGEVPRDFGTTLEDFERQDAPRKSFKDSTVSQDEFSFGNVKDVVRSKLREMRPL